MRKELFYNPRSLIERLGVASLRRRRKRRLKGTIAEGLHENCLESLELLDLTRPFAPGVFFDIGANEGSWSILVKAIFPEAIVHAFEPLVEPHTNFNKALMHVPGVHLHPVGLGSSEGRGVMNVASSIDASSLLGISELAGNRWKISKQGEREISVVCLDEYSTAKSLPFADVMKLDVQGYELEVLRGAEKWLENCKCVICEVSFVSFYEKQPLFHDVVGFMKERGFHLRGLGVDTPLGQNLFHTDVLFLRDGLG